MKDKRRTESLSVTIKKPTNLTESFLQTVKTSAIGNLKYDKVFNIDKLKKDSFLSPQVSSISSRRFSHTEERIQNSFEIEKQNKLRLRSQTQIVDNESEEVIKRTKYFEKENAEASKIIDEITFSPRHSVNRILSEIDENDRKEIELKTKALIQKFQEIRTSPKGSPEIRQQKNFEDKLSELRTKELMSIEEKIAEVQPHLKANLQDFKAQESLSINDKESIKNMEQFIEQVDKDLLTRCIIKLKYVFTNKQVNEYNKDFEQLFDTYQNYEYKQYEYLKLIEKLSQDRQERVETASIAKKQMLIDKMKIFEKKFNYMIEVLKNQTNLIANNKYKDKLINNLKSIQSIQSEIDTQINQINSYLIISVTLDLKSINEKKCEETVNSLELNERRLQQSVQDLMGQIDNDIKNLSEQEKTELAKREAEKKDEERRQEEARKLAAEKAKQEAERIKQEEDRKKAEAEKAVQAQKLKDEEAKQQSDSINKSGIMQHSLELYNKITTEANQIRKELEAIFNADASLKSYRFELQKAINFPLNSLLNDESSVAAQREFMDKVKTITRLLSGQTCTITSTLTVNPNKHKRATEYCMEYLARKLIEKSEETVASRPETAFQYVTLITNVTKQFPLFNTLLLASIYEKCPYAVPYYKAKSDSQSVEDYLKSVGYYVNNGKVEEDEYYYKRMSGILHLYFTLLMDKDYLNGNGYKHAWTWLADTLNTKPRLDITAHILTIFFKCCGHRLYHLYRIQFKKIMVLFINEYYPKIVTLPNQTKAFLGRLDLIINEYKAKGNFEDWK